MNTTHPQKTSKRASYLYILLTNTGTAFSRLIQSFTNAPYNHASISLDPELNELYSFGRKTARNPLNAGFIQEDVYHGTYSYYQHTSCIVLRLKVTHKEKDAVRAAIRVFEQNKELYSYNLIGLIGVLMNRELGIQHARFCSEFVAEVLGKGGLNLWDSRPSALVTPHHFYEHPRLEKMYEGRLTDYPELDAMKLYHAQANRYQTRTAALKVN
ncbi:hypothetical protein DX130_20480 [Paenibacillus paeoniae]|uniref:Uncharacterized protein n=2 Tax=Paenibacillus paeoniae TaxID=2292705 RepID=A0A371P6T8_9BACL|nr:hypothetical protein DX130_20480 [Paenibacillus paeoniae]